MKTEAGAKNCLYPLPTTIIGALVDEKPNFITMAHVGIMDPCSVSLGMNKIHYTNRGIKENETFSINLPSIDLVEKTDYCGLVSGKTVDKSNIFKIFYGKLEKAPMIEECPINMECKLLKTVDFPNHDIFIGEVVNTFYDDVILTDGKPDIAKLKPLLFAMHDQSYWGIGEKIAKAWYIGKDMKCQEKCEE